MTNASLALLGRDRAPFLPNVIWIGVEDDDGFTQDVRVDRRTDSQAWRNAADSDDVVVTQWDDGEHDAPGTMSVPTCTASLPTVVRRMLDACDVQDGQRVLEIGTGTGYTAALLKDRVGPNGRVVSVEVDAQLATSARKNLAAAGVDVEVVCADGMNGWEAGAPYDRVHVTCAVRQIPSAWLVQCPHGMITTPWGTAFGGGDNRLASLTVRDGVAVGGLGDRVSFMAARSQRVTPWGDWPDTGDALESALPVTWHEIEAPLNDTSASALGLLLPNVTFRFSGSHDDEDGRVLWLERDGEYASIGFGEHHATTVAGDRAIIGAYTRALRWWLDHDRPQPEQFGLRVSADGEYARQEVWYRSPDRLVSLGDG